MANIFELNININVTDKTETEQALEETENGSTEGGDAEGTAENKKSKSTAVATGLVIGKKVFGDIKREVFKQMSFQTNLLSAKFGDVARQNEINNFMTTADAGLNIISTTASYASMGAMAGPVGMAIGAVIGVVSSVSSTIIDMYHRSYEWDIQNQNYQRESNRAMERLGVLTASKGR